MTYAIFRPEQESPVETVRLQAPKTSTPAWILGIVLGLGAATVSAQDNADKVRESAGAYLQAVDVTTHFQQSRCGYLLEGKTIGVERALEEVTPYLNASDANELRSFLSSEKFRSTQRENREFIDDWFRSASAHGEDERSTCEAMRAGVAKIYETAQTTWEQTKRAYAKRR